MALFKDKINPPPAPLKLANKSYLVCSVHNPYINKCTNKFKLYPTNMIKLFLSLGSTGCLAIVQ